MEISICRRCGKVLKNPISIRLGIGPVCLEKETGKPKGSRITALHSSTIPRLFDIKKKEETPIQI
jgi:hypothetical protein